MPDSDLKKALERAGLTDIPELGTDLQANCLPGCTDCITNCDPGCIIHAQNQQ